MNRKEQYLTECDLTLKEYTEVGNLYNDYREIDDGLWAVCDYNFLKHLVVGDVLMLVNEDTQNFSPWVVSIELDENNRKNKLFRVTRKIYSAGGLDVYVVETDDDLEK